VSARPPGSRSAKRAPAPSGSSAALRPPWRGPAPRCRARTGHRVPVGFVGRRRQGSPAGQRPAGDQQRVGEGRVGGRRGRVQRAAAHRREQATPSSMGRHPSGRWPRTSPPHRRAAPLRPGRPVEARAAAGGPPGTRDPEGVAGFTALTRRLTAREAHCGRTSQRRGDGWTWPAAHRAVAPPLRDAVSDLAPAATHPGCGPADAVRRPATPGDVPDALARETARHPGLVMSTGRPLARTLSCQPAGGPRRGGRAGARPVRTRCWSSAAAPPTRTPTPNVCRTPGCCGGPDYSSPRRGRLAARPSVAEGLERCLRRVPHHRGWRAYFLFRWRACDRSPLRPAAFATPIPAWTSVQRRARRLRRGRRPRPSSATTRPFTVTSG